MCPAAPAHFTLEPEPVFAHRHLSMAVSQESHISFEDYQRMSTRTHTGPRRPCPAFMLDPEKLRALIVRAVENRAGLRHPWPGTLTERLKRAEAKLLATKARKLAVLDNLCKKYVAAKRAGEPCRKLAQSIEGLDSTISTLDRPAAIIGAVLFLSYRSGLDSVAVSQQLQGAVKPVTVRQILHRVKLLSQGMKPPRVYPHPSERVTGVCY